MTSSDIVDRYIQASAGFGEQVVATGDEEWDLPTPCSEWNTKMLVAHVVLGDAQVPEFIAGRVGASAAMDVSILGPDPVSVWRGTALRAIEALGGADLNATVAHPLGEMPLEQMLGFRITDNLVHAWDLALGRGDTMNLDEGLAEWCLEFWVPLASALDGSTFFGPMVEPASQSAGDRLLGLLGRAPTT